MKADLTTPLFPGIAIRVAPDNMPAASSIARLDGSQASDDGDPRAFLPMRDLGPRRPWVYRSKVARELGRPLTRYEIVHHINGDYTDNRLDNLMLLNSQKAHMLLHAIQREQDRGAMGLFTIQEHLHFHGVRVLWATETGLRQVFGI